MTTYRRDVISSAVFGVAAVILYIYVASFPVRQGQPAAVSAGFYPKILAGALGVLAVIQAVSAVVARTRSTGGSAPDRVRFWKDPASLRLLLFTLLMLVAYPFVMRLLGFALTGLLFLGTLIFALSRDQRRGKQTWIILGTALAIGVVAFIVFRYFLNIPFPRGLLFRL